MVLYIEKNNTKLVFKTTTGEYSTYSSFNKFQNKLPPTFIRCHKSYIANVSNINHIDNTTIHFDKTNDVKCYIGQVYKKNFLEVLNYESNTNSTTTY